MRPQDALFPKGEKNMIRSTRQALLALTCALIALGSAGGATAKGNPKINEINARLDAQQTKIDALASENSDQQTQIDVLISENAVQQADIDTLLAENRDQEARIAELEAELACPKGMDRISTNLCISSRQPAADWPTARQACAEKFENARICTWGDIRQASCASGWTGLPLAQPFLLGDVTNEPPYLHDALGHVVTTAVTQCSEQIHASGGFSTYFMEDYYCCR